MSNHREQIMLNYRNPIADCNISTGPALLVIPKVLHAQVATHSLADVLNKEFLLSMLSEDEWRSWYMQQRTLGDLAPLYEYMPEIYINFFSKATGAANLLKGAEADELDTSELVVSFRKAASLKADSLHVAMFNKDISKLPSNELITTLNGGLLKYVGVEVYARINRGYIFKQAMTIA